jgi:hypothetical protein
MDQNGFNNNNFFQGDVFIDGDTDIDGNLTVSGTYPGGGGGGSVNNPMTSNLNANGFNITNVESVLATYVDTDNINPKVGTHINVLANLDLNSNGITRIDRITCRTTASPSADLKLDLVPATVGTANQVLARDPAFDPALSGHTKTVWLDAVLNPMTANLNVNGYSLTNVLGIGATNGGVANINLNGDIKSTVGNYISGITNLIGYSGTINIQGDVKITDSLDLSTKNINRVEVLDTNYIESKTNSIVRFNSDTHMLNNLVVFGDIVLDYKSIFNVERITASHASVMLNLDMIPATQGTANQVLARDPAFNPANPATHKLVWQTVSGGGGVSNPMSVDLDAGGFNINNVETLTCNYIDTDSIVPKTGSSILVSGDINLNSNGILRCDRLTGFTTATPSVDLKLDMIPATQGTANQVLARDPAFNPANSATHKLVWQTVSGGVQNPMTANLDGGNFTITNLSSLTSTELKTTSIALSSGTIIQTSPLAVNTQLKVNTINPLTNPTILMPSVDFSGTLKTNTINNYTGSSVNITATDVNISNKLNVLTNRSSSIGVRTTLFKTFGAMPSVNINSLTPVKLNSIIANQKGDNFMPPGAFTNGDKFIITMYGNLTTLGSGSLNVYLYVGAVQAVSFNVINTGLTNQPAKFTFEIDCTVSGNNVDLSNGTALLSAERFNTSIRFSVGTLGSLVPNNGLSNSIDIYVAQVSAQVSSFTPLSYTIEQL